MQSRKSVLLNSLLAIATTITQLLAPAVISSNSVNNPNGNGTNSLTASISSDSTVAQAVTSTPSSLETKYVQQCFNSSYIGGIRNATYYKNSPAWERLEKHTLAYYTDYLLDLTNWHCQYQGKWTSTQAKAAENEALRLFDSQVAPNIVQLANSAGYGQTVANQIVKVYRQATILNISFKGQVDDFINTPQEKAIFNQYKSGLMQLHKDSQLLQVYMTSRQVSVLVSNANADSLNQLYSLLGVIAQEVENTGKPNTINGILPNFNWTGMGQFNMPTLTYSGGATLWVGVEQSIQDSMLKELQTYRQRTILLQLAENLFGGIAQMQAKGISRLDSFYYLMGELGFDLFLGVTDVPLTNTRKVLATIPESELRAAAKRTSNPTKAAQLVDDIKGKKGGSGSGDSLTPCVASVPGSVGFIAIASDVPTMEFSSGETLVAALPADAIAISSTCLAEVNKFLKNNPQYEMVGNRVIPKGAKTLPGRRNSVWRGKVYPADVLELNMKLNRANGILDDAQKAALAEVRKKGGIYFDDEGFPDFRPFAYKGDAAKYTVDLGAEWTGTSKDFSIANRRKGFKENPDGYTWHHIPNSNELVLVDRNVHAKVGHTGGVGTGGSQGTD